MKAHRQQRGTRKQSKLLFSCPVSSLHSRVNRKRHRHFHTACTVSSEICSDICCIITKQTEFHSSASYKINGLVHLTLVSFQTCNTIFHAIQFFHAIPMDLKGCKSTINYIYSMCSDTNCAFIVDFKEHLSWIFRKWLFM